MSNVSSHIDCGQQERIRFADLQRRIRRLPRWVTTAIVSMSFVGAVVLKSMLEDRGPFASSLLNALFVWAVLLGGYLLVCSVVGFALAYLSLRWFPPSDDERRSPRAWLIPQRR